VESVASTGSMLVLRMTSLDSRSSPYGRHTSQVIILPTLELSQTTRRHSSTSYSILALWSITTRIYSLLPLSIIDLHRCLPAFSPRTHDTSSPTRSPRSSGTVHALETPLPPGISETKGFEFLGVFLCGRASVFGRRHRLAWFVDFVVRFVRGRRGVGFRAGFEEGLCFGSEGHGGSGW